MKNINENTPQVTKIKKFFAKNWRVILGIAISVLAVVFVVTQWDSIRRSLDVLSHAQPGWVILAITAHIGSILFAALVYFFVSLKPISYVRLAVAQTSSLFTARVTPAGLGGMATMVRVLITSKQTAIQAGAAFSANAVVTFLGNIALIAVALALTGKSAASSFKLPVFVWILPALLILIGLLFWFVPKLHNLVEHKVREILKTLSGYKTRKLKLFFGFLAGLLVTTCYMLSLWLVAKSLGVNITPLAAIVTLSIGTVGAAVTPLPGGVIGAEAALVAALTQFGISTEQALAVAVLYRFVTYWLPILPGYIATQIAFKLKYL